MGMMEDLHAQALDSWEEDSTHKLPTYELRHRIDYMVAYGLTDDPLYDEYVDEIKERTE